MSQGKKKGDISEGCCRTGGEVVGVTGSIGMGSPGLGDGGLQGRGEHWKSWVWGSGWKQQGCLVGGTAQPA